MRAIDPSSLWQQRRPMDQDSRLPGTLKVAGVTPPSPPPGPGFFSAFLFFFGFHGLLEVKEGPNRDSTRQNRDAQLALATVRGSPRAKS